MISFLTLILNTVTSAFLYVLKAFFSMLTWFLKTFFKLLKLFFAVLPITALVFAILFVFNIVLLTGLNLPLGIVDSVKGEPGLQLQSILTNNSNNLHELFTALKLWWGQTLAPYRGTFMHTLLLILAVIMFVPVMSVFLCWSVFSSFGLILFFTIVSDAVLYVLRAILGQSFVAQIRGRYYRLFRSAGLRHEEKIYEKNLRRRNRDLEEELREKSYRSRDDYYEEEWYEEDNYDEDYEDEEFDEAYEEEYEPTHRRSFFRHESYSRDEEYEDEEDYDGEYEEDLEDDYDDPRSAPAPSTSFDFFAGCSSRESVDRKYKSLVKLYHPDNMDGDTAALQEINIQYSEAKKRFT